MQDRRRAEIEAKRAKLADLRKAREERKAAMQTDPSRRESENSSPANATLRDVNDLVNALIGPRSDAGVGTSTDFTPSSVPSTPARGRVSTPAPGPSNQSHSAAESDAGSERLGYGPSSSRSQDIPPYDVSPMKAPDLVDVEQELFELPQKHERVSYNKEVQTANFDEEDDRPSEQEIRLRVKREQEAEREAERERELEEESIQLEIELEEELRELTEEERASILIDPSFMDFVDQSSKIVERVLQDRYDYTRDYRISGDSAGDDSEGEKVKRVCSFSDERWTKNRSITDVDWSHKYPELIVASYNKNPSAPSDPDGIVAVWNLHLLERPEFIFHSQSDVLSVTFSPFHSNLVFGGTYSGEVLLWDTRSNKHLPVLKTTRSGTGHFYPIYSMQVVGTQNAHNLFTGDTDGMVCTWLVDMLAQPQEMLRLTHSSHAKTDDVAITCLDFPANETSTFWVGTEEGNVYQAHRHDRAGARAGLQHQDVYRGHRAPVTGLDFHPLMGPVDFSDLFLTCSLDWKVKLWRAKTSPTTAQGMHDIYPLHTFDAADEAVYDVKWHPQNPAVFGSVDGSGKFDLWDLNIDTDVPIVSTQVSVDRAINKMVWEPKEGRRAALGAAGGMLHVYDIGDTGVPRESEWTDLQRTLIGLPIAQPAPTYLESESRRGSIVGYLDGDSRRPSFAGSMGDSRRGSAYGL